MDEEAKGLEAFTAWFCKNYPGPDTIIHKPEWHAPKIWRAATTDLAATITRLTAERDEARAECERKDAALLQGVLWFEEYAGHHAEKLAMDKAARNTERAMFLRTALTAAAKEPGK